MHAKGAQFLGNTKPYRAHFFFTLGSRHVCMHVIIPLALPLVSLIPVNCTHCKPLQAIDMIGASSTIMWHENLLIFEVVISVFYLFLEVVISV